MEFLVLPEAGGRLGQPEEHRLRQASVPPLQLEVPSRGLQAPVLDEDRDPDALFQYPVLIIRILRLIEDLLEQGEQTIAFLVQRLLLFGL